MTPQEAVDQAYSKLMTQGQGAIALGDCCYSTLPLDSYSPERFCALGILLEPETARRIERDTSYQEGLAEICAILDLDWQFAKELQRCHDIAALQRDFKKTLTGQINVLCYKHTLTPPQEKT